VGDIISGVGLGIFSPGYWAPTAIATFLLKFLLETRI